MKKAVTALIISYISLLFAPPAVCQEAQQQPSTSEQLKELRETSRELKSSIESFEMLTKKTEEFNKERNEHLRTDFSAFKNELRNQVATEHTKIGDELESFVMQYVYGISLGILTFMTGIGIIMYKTIKARLDFKSKEIVEGHAKEIHDELVESILDVNGQSLFHWWIFYKDVLPAEKAQYQKMVTVLCERTFALIRTTDDITYDKTVLVDYTTNALYFLADIDDEGLLAERRPLVKSLFKRFESLLLNVPANQRDGDWADRMDCLCFAIYKFGLRKHKTVKEYLIEAFCYLPDSAVNEIKRNYPDISFGQ